MGRETGDKALLLNTKTEDRSFLLKDKAGREVGAVASCRGKAESRGGAKGMQSMGTTGLRERGWAFVATASGGTAALRGQRTPRGRMGLGAKRRATVSLAPPAAGEPMESRGFLSFPSMEVSVLNSSCLEQKSLCFSRRDSKSVALSTVTG
jgi:hypothetical protein